MTDKIAEYFAKLTGEKFEIAVALRELVEALAPNSPSDVKWNALVYYKDSRPFIGIMPYTKYISVIFDRGAELQDSVGVLEGEGVNMRHIKVRSVADIAEKQVRQYIEQSYALD